MPLKETVGATKKNEEEEKRKKVKKGRKNWRRLSTKAQIWRERSLSAPFGIVLPGAVYSVIHKSSLALNTSFWFNFDITQLKLH